MTHDAPPCSAPLRRLRRIGLFAPLAFVAVMISMRPFLMDAFGIRAAHLILGTVLFGSAGLFGWTMHRLLGRAHEAVVEAERQTAALVERERIARELHDSLAQVLGVTHLRLRALSGRRALASEDRLRAEVDDLADLCREAHRDVREAILGLKDAHRPERTLAEQLEAYVATFERTSSIPTTLHAEAQGDLGLSPAAEVQVIRVIQEALTNVRKHARARQAGVRISTHDDHTAFVVEDDGRGFDPAHAPVADGFGLCSMRERTESVGGRFTIESTPGRGTRVVVLLPGGTGPQRAAEPGTPSRVPVQELSA